MSAARFRRLPVVVDALRFDRDGPGNVARVRAFAPGAQVGPAHVVLPGGARAEQGWWIVRDALGVYSTLPDIAFRAQYEALSQDDALRHAGASG